MMSQTIHPTLETLRAQRGAILSLASKYGAYNVRVFGSVARGEAKQGSDVDLLVSVKDGVSVFDLVGLWLDLQELLQQSVSLVPDESSDPHFQARILQDAVPL